MSIIMKYLKFINHWYIYLISRVNFWYAKKKADKLHKLTGKRYHVVRTDEKGHFTCLDNKANVKYMDILKYALYSTSVQGLTRK